MKYLLALFRRPTLALWCLFVFSMPLYVMPSGMPQPSTLLIFIVVPAMLVGWNKRLNIKFTRTLRPLLLLTLWICLVNYGWVIIFGKTTVLKSYAIFPIYYIFNVAVFSTVLILFQRFGDLALRWTVYAVYAAVGFQVAASFVYRTELYRGQLFFNSPNQLGFYALLAASLLAMSQRRIGFGLLKASAGLTGCAYLAALSASRASLGGIAILFFLLVFQNPRVIVFASLVAVGLITLGGPIANAIDTVETRVNRNRNANLSFAEERGYDRLWKYKEYMLVGAGEGDVTRFKDNPTSAGELHSSFATVLFSYGFVGLAIFMVFLWRVVRGAGTRHFLMLVPTLAFTLAHNGLRFTMLWLLLAVFVVLKVKPAPAPKLADVERAVA